MPEMDKVDPWEQ